MLNDNEDSSLIVNKMNYNQKKQSVGNTINNNISNNKAEKLSIFSKFFSKDNNNNAKASKTRNEINNHDIPKIEQDIHTIESVLSLNSNIRLSMFVVTTSFQIFLLIFLDQIRDYLIYPFIRRKSFKLSEAYSSFSTIYDILVLHLPYSFTKKFQDNLLQLILNKNHKKALQLTHKAYILFLFFGLFIALVYYFILDSVYYLLLKNKETHAIIVEMFKSISFGIPIMYLRIVNMRFLDAMNKSFIITASSIIGVCFQLLFLYIFLEVFDIVNHGVSFAINIGIFVSFLIQFLYTIKYVSELNTKEYKNRDINENGYSESYIENNKNCDLENSEYIHDEDIINHSNLNNNAESKEWIESKENSFNYLISCTKQIINYYPSYIKLLKNDISSDLLLVVKDIIYYGSINYFSILSFEMITFFGLIVGDHEYTLLNYLINLLKFIFLMSDAISSATISIMKAILNKSLSLKHYKSNLVFRKAFYLITMYVFVFSILISMHYTSLLGFFTNDIKIISLSHELKSYFILAFIILSYHNLISGSLELLGGESFSMLSCFIGKILITILVSIHLIVNKGFKLDGIFIAIILGELVSTITNIFILGYHYKESGISLDFLSITAFLNKVITIFPGYNNETKNIVNNNMQLKEFFENTDFEDEEEQILHVKENN